MAEDIRNTIQTTGIQAFEKKYENPDVILVDSQYCSMGRMIAVKACENTEYTYYDSVLLLELVKDTGITISDVEQFEKQLRSKTADLSEIKTSIKIATSILVLALLSSIIKSLENSFSSKGITTVTNYIVFITVVTLTLVSFRDILSLCYTTIENIMGLVNVIIPIMISLLVLVGFPITSTALNPIFIGGIAAINIIFKKFIYL